METRLVPATKLWDNLIVLECVCGAAVNYPGHPDEVTSSRCDCGRVYRVADLAAEIPTTEAGG